MLRYLWIVAGVALAWSSDFRICHAEDLDAGPDIAAIEYLGTVDCFWYPEAQEVLIGALTKGPQERIRYAAVMALTAQAQRGNAPLDPTTGWRRVPDPLILTQIVRVATFRKPLTRQELLERYHERQVAYLGKNKQASRRGDTDCGCCTEALINALARTAYDRDLYGCWVEPSDRIRWRAERALGLCCDQTQMSQVREQYRDPTEPLTDPNNPDLPPLTPDQMPQNEVSPDNFASSQADIGGSSNPFERDFDIGGLTALGRADYANRFNIFDNMSAAPMTRVWYGYQFVGTQNNAVIQTGDTARLFSMLNTSSGRSDFIAITGFGRQPGEPAVDPNDEQSGNILKDQFLNANGGRSQKYLLNPDASLHRFGFEWALTPDFSLSVMDQYVMPMSDNEQPNSFSNPSIQLKHVLYRDADNLYSGVFNVQPQISRPAFSVGEDTTRLTSGLLSYNRLTEKLFMQNALAFSFPVDSDKINTFDFAFGGGYWLYKHESLEPYYTGPPANSWLLGFIPQFEVLGKAVLGNNTVTGQFNLKSSTSVMAAGTVNGLNTNTIYFPDGSVFDETAFIYRESRCNVDFTFGATSILKRNLVISTGMSFPVTGGNARAVEFLSTINKYF